MYVRNQQWLPKTTTKHTNVNVAIPSRQSRCSWLICKVCRARTYCCTASTDCSAPYRPTSHDSVNETCFYIWHGRKFVDLIIEVWQQYAGSFRDNERRINKHTFNIQKSFQKRIYKVRPGQNSTDVGISKIFVYFLVGHNWKPRNTIFQILKPFCALCATGLRQKNENRTFSTF